MRESMETIKANVGRAAQELVELLNAKSPEIRRRAATDLINFALKWKDSKPLPDVKTEVRVVYGALSGRLFWFLAV